MLFLALAATSASAREKYHEAFKNAATQETFQQTFTAFNHGAHHHSTIEDPMKSIVAFAFAACALLALPVSARDKVDPAVNASTRDAFETVSTWVRQQMDSGGRYSYVTAGERSKVNEQLDKMSSLFQTSGDTAKMTDADKTAMFNSQEEVNAILAKRDNDRLICRNETPIGSHIPVKTCQTAGVIEARRRNDTDYLRRNQNSPQLRSGS
jgi:hypothetical protein